MVRRFYYIALLMFMCNSYSYAQLPASFTFDTETKYTSGYNITVTDQFSYYVAISLGGSMTVKVAGDLINGANSIPVSNIKLQLSSMRNGGVTLNLVNTKPLVTLSTTPTAFYSGLSVSLFSTLYYTFSYQTAGGAAFLNKPAGTYSTTLTFASGSTTMATATLSVVISNVGTITAGNGTLAFNSATAYKSGLQTSQTNLVNNVFSNQPYKILIKAQAAQISNGINTIAVSNVAAAIDPAPSVALSTTNQLLAPSAGTVTPTLTRSSFTVKWITQALNTAFINKPTGDYSVNLTVSLVDASGSAFPASAPATASFTLTVTLSNTTTITLASGADNAQLAFTGTNDYKTGISLTQNDALNIFSNNPYMLSVKTATAGLTYLSHTIPASNIRLLSTPNPITGSLTATTISLGSTAQTIANASSAGSGTFSQNFHLKYFTQAMNSAFINLPAGVYTTTLTYTVTLP